jgi:1,4-dihydroxy-2-naphthoate octaprenyltransferase
MRKDLWRGLWRLADPRISLASFASIFLAACLALRTGSIDWAWLAFTVVGVFAIEIAKNASGEVVDYDSGADLAVRPEDRSPFSGGKRVLVDRLLSRQETIRVAVGFYALAVAIGLYIVAFRDWRILSLGILGVSLAYFYHASPLKLAYRGFGEIAVALCYGPLLCAGTYLVQRGDVAAEVYWLSAGLGLLIGAFLWINEFPDYNADRESKKWTLVARMGRRRASHVFVLIVSAAFITLALAPLLSPLPVSTLLGLAGLPFAMFAARRIVGTPESTRQIVAAQGATLLCFLGYSLGTGIGLLLP